MNGPSVHIRQYNDDILHIEEPTVNNTKIIEAISIRLNVILLLSILNPAVVVDHIDLACDTRL